VKGRSPYRNAPPSTIRTAINEVLSQCENPAIQSVELAAAQKLKSGDLDLYTHTVAEKERLIYNSAVWLPQIEQGHLARILDTQYSVLAHSAPTEFFPQSRVAEVIKEVQLANPASLAYAEITHLSWAKGHNATGGMKRSSLVLAFSDPLSANRIIQEGLFLRSERLRTELYDPSYRAVQCAKCLLFGHVMAMCSAAVCCPLCSLAHSRNQCPDRKNPTKYKCALCGGQHAATNRAQCPKWIEQLTVLEGGRRKKPRLFLIPGPAETPVGETGQPPSAQTTPPILTDSRLLPSHTAPVP
jgi:hypothetical protein